MVSIYALLLQNGVRRRKGGPGESATHRDQGSNQIQDGEDPASITALWLKP